MSFEVIAKDVAETLQDETLAQPGLQLTKQAFTAVPDSNNVAEMTTTQWNSADLSPDHLNSCLRSEFCKELPKFESNRPKGQRTVITERGCLEPSSSGADMKWEMRKDRERR